MKRIICMIFAPALLLLLCACGSAQSAETAGNAAICVSDLNGREIRLEKPATRIVALSPSDCEILYAIGAGDTIIGRAVDADYPEALLSVPALEYGAGLNIEQITALQPELVLFSDSNHTPEQVEAIERAGMKTVCTDSHINHCSIEGIYTDIELIAALVGKETEGEKLIASMRSSLAELAEKAGDGSRSVYFEVSPLEYGLWTAGTETFFDEVCTLIGARNIFSDVNGWAEVSEEQVIERDPDNIVTISMSYGDVTPTDEILSRSGWENIKAVKNGKILNFVNNELTRPGPRIVDGARMLYDFVYGNEA